MSLRIKKGDKVVVLAGKNKGKMGKVLRVDLSKERMLVEGVNLVKKHFRKRSENEPGGIKEIPASLHISNLMLVENGTTTKVGYRMEGDKKVRFSKKSKEVL